MPPRTRLLRARAEVVARLEGAPVLVAAGHGDEGEQAVSSVTAETSAAGRHALRRRLRAIDDALDRLAEGGYGACCDCGEDIPVARLVAVPEAALCVRCAADRERLARQRATRGWADEEDGDA